MKHVQAEVFLAQTILRICLKFRVCVVYMKCIGILVYIGLHILLKRTW